MSTAPGRRAKTTPTASTARAAPGSPAAPAAPAAPGAPAAPAATAATGALAGVGAIGWVTLALVCASAVLAGLLEVMFLGEFYWGKQIVPVVVVAAILSNLLLSWLGFRAVTLVRGAALPVLFWLIAVLALTLYNPPEGDLFVITSFGEQGAFYALLLLGAIAGFGLVVLLASRTGFVDPRFADPRGAGRAAEDRSGATARKVTDSQTARASTSPPKPPSGPKRTGPGSGAANKPRTRPRRR